MNQVKLVWNYLFARPLAAILNIVLLSLGIAMITILILLRNQLEEKISENARGIDLVIGAKGSPMQLILCNIFHVDFPTGNIKLVDAEKICRNRLVKNAVPLALGDSYRDFRIIGTSRGYAEMYNAELASGAWFTKPMETVIGANVAAALKPGDQFESNHGLTAEGHAHDERAFVVTGVMKPTNTIIDNLILTQVESVWLVHDTHVSFANDSAASRSKLVPSVSSADSTIEITSVLIEYRSPMGAIQLPRMVNAESALQAASPAFETARLFSILGIGFDIVNGFAYLLIVISALSIFIALYNALKERKYDLAIMRTMGSTKTKLFVTIIFEGIMLTLLGCVAGLVIGHSVLLILSQAVEEFGKAGVSGLSFYTEEWIILAASLLLGTVCSAIPAIQVYRTDISRVLAGN